VSLTHSRCELTLQSDIVYIWCNIDTNSVLTVKYCDSHLLYIVVMCGLVFHVTYVLYSACVSGLLWQAVVQSVWKSSCQCVWLGSAGASCCFLCTATEVWLSSSCCCR